MMHVIAYDISDDSTRLRISKLLEGYGQRVQESVFECLLDEKQLKLIVENMKKLLKTGGNIRIYQLCKACSRKAQGIGEITPQLGEEGYLII